MFSSAPFLRIGTTWVTRLDDEGELSLSVASVTRPYTNVESMFSSARFVRIGTTSVTRLNAEVELTLLNASYIRIDTTSVIRLDANSETTFLVTLNGKVKLKLVYT